MKGWSPTSNPCPARPPMPERRWARAGETLWRRSLDAVVLMPPGAAEPLTLVGTGAALWDLLEAPSSTDALVAALADRFGADPGTVEADLLPVLDQLAELGAIRG